jgi:NAD(P)-dependent dehydrogenase (short-subunit alcohol dehydrogenase family)
MRLDGKVAVIIGGEGDLGQEVTRLFLDEGARLTIGW